MTDYWPDELSRHGIVSGNTFVADWEPLCGGTNRGVPCTEDATFFASWHPSGDCMGFRLCIRRALLCSGHLQVLEAWTEHTIRKHQPAWYVRWFRDDTPRCKCGLELQLPTDILQIVTTL